MSFTEDFRAEMKSAGLDWLGPIVPDGKIHRFRVSDDGADNSWYCLFAPNPIAAGSYGCWKRQFTNKWHQKNGQAPRGKELADLQRQWKEAEAQRDRDEADRHKRMADRATEFIKDLPRPARDHLYLETKQVNIFGDLRETLGGELVLPLVDAEGKTWSYQTIDPLGSKLFMPLGRVAGCFFWVNDRQDGPLVICEGYATGATIHEATGWSVCCAMNCGNLMGVARALRQKNPQRTVVIAADNDRFTAQGGMLKNPGLEKAQEAAKSTKSLLCCPQFPDTDKKGTDFNDLQKATSINAVRSAFEAVTGVGLGQRVTIKSLLSFIPSEDKDSVLGNRYLCRGSSCMIVGQTHVGKSSFGMQMAVHLALGGDFFGIAPNRPLKSLIAQAENDDGDTAEMLQGILLGTGLIDNKRPEKQVMIAKSLEQNLIIYRDQTHMGRDFPGYAEKLIELHRPDFFWIDPLLSFYGDDINDQQAMSKFLRSYLNPISERTGIIWMVMHHTGKPAKDQAKMQKSWVARDFAYTGIGSSELSNWARAIIAINHSSEGEFRVVLAKRGWRAGLKDDRGAPTSELYLAHGDEHICWKRIPKPDEERTEAAIGGFVRTIISPMRPSEIVRLAVKHFQRSVRTCWTMWDGGQGKLGVQFVQDGDLWIPRSETAPLPYKED